MTIDAISFLPPVSALPLPPDDEVSAPALQGPDFSAWIEREFNTLNSKMVTADEGVRALATGEPVDLHRVMIDVEQAKLSLQLMLQVRNHLMDAYQDIVKMPI